MSSPSRSLAFLSLALAAPTVAGEASPVSKVLQLLSDLQVKIVKEGEAAQKEYASYAEWCENKAAELQYEIKTSKAWVAELKAKLVKEDSIQASLTTEIEELAGKQATAEADLKAATEIRDREHATFASEEAELVDIISSLERAVAVLTREMQKGGASMMQLKQTNNIVEAFNVLVQGAMLSSADASRLTALVQTNRLQASDDADDGDLELGAPDAATYKSHSGNIIETLEGLLDKAQSQLDSSRKSETNEHHNYEMLRQSLTDEIRFASDELAGNKQSLAASKEATGVANGDLDVTSKDLASDQADLAHSHQLCMTTAQDFEAAVKSRNEELEALSAAKKTVSEMTGGATSLTYGLNQVSFLQDSQLRLHTRQPHAVSRFLLDLSRTENDRSLAQLAYRISSIASAARLGRQGAGQDPFGKIKGLISDMIGRLEDDAHTDASHKAYCDKETGESMAKKDEKTTLEEKLTSKIDQMTSRIAILQEEVATLMKELAELAKSQSAYDGWMRETEATYAANKADMESGIEGVKLALSVLRDYLSKDGKSHSAADGGTGGVVGLLEVVESDFTKGLAEMTASMTNQKAAYDQTTKENEVTRTMKDQDVKYKTKEMTSLKKALNEATSDRSMVQSELDAILEYLSKIHEQCVEKAETYDSRKGRREAEIAGLKEALSILEGEAVLFQKDDRTKREHVTNFLRSAFIQKHA